MKFCMNCGAQMEDADVFCQKCGYRAVMLEEPAPAADQQLWGTLATPPQQGGRAVGQPWETPAASPKKRKTLLLILIIVAAVVLMAAGGFVYLKLNDMKLSDLFSGAEEGAAAEDVPGEQSPGTDKDAGASGKRKPAENEDYYGTWSMNGSQVAYYEIGPADPDAAEIRFHFNRTGYKPYYELDGDGTGTLENGVLRVPMYYVFYKEDSRGNATQMGFGPFEETWTFAADLPEDYVLSEAEQLMTDTGYPAPDWEDCRTSGDYLVRRAEQQPEKLNEYVLWFSSDVFVSEEDVSLLSDTEFRFALNEIYARHGKKFSAGDLQSYFDSLSWYTGTVEEDAFDESCLNDFERENVAFLSRYQKNDSVAEANDVPLSEEECIGWTAKIDEVIGGTERPNMATVWTGDTGLDEVMRKNGVSDYEVRFYYDRDFNLLKAEAVIDETCTEYYYYCVGPECYVIAQKGQDGTVYRPEISELISSITERGYKLGHG